MNKTYFAPTTSEVKFAGNNCILSGSDIPSTDPNKPVIPGGEGMAPARKLFV